MKTRKQPTAEQKAKAAERRERFAALAKQIAELSDGERSALVAKVGAIVTVEGRALSVHNSCLVLMQCPNASLVGGFRQWQEHGRRVVKGATGLALWIPTGRGSTSEPTAADVSEATPAEEGDKGKRRAFTMAYVFDVSQTQPIEGEDASKESNPEPVAVNPLECRMCGCTGESAERCTVCGHAFPVG